MGPTGRIDNSPAPEHDQHKPRRARIDGSTFFHKPAALVTNATCSSLPHDPQKDFIRRLHYAAHSACWSTVADRSLQHGPQGQGRAWAATLGNEGPRTFSGVIARDGGAAED